MNWKDSIFPIPRIKIDYLNIKTILYLILMIYLTCPTCGFFLGSKTIEFETKKAEICNNPNLNEQQQGDEISKLVLTLNIRRYCCRMRLITAKDIVQDVLPVS